MKKVLSLLSSGLIAVALFLSVNSCEKLVEPQPTPTKDLMQGIWKVTAATDSSGKDLLTKIAVPTVIYSLTSDNGISSTSGPMISLLVYGDNKWTQVQSTIGECFDYAALTYTTGEYFLATGVVDRFTLEMKLKGIGGTSTLDQILTLFGAGTSQLAQSLDKTIYHKFLNVGIRFENNDQRMIWTFDNITTTKYSVKDQYGEPGLFTGWNLPYKRGCTFTLEKQVKTLTDLTNEAYGNK